MLASEDLIFIDFESAAAGLDIKALGTPAYSAIAEATVCAFAIGDGSAQVWHAEGAILDWNDAPAELKRAFENGALFAAWNAGFDSMIWNYSTLEFPFLEPERIIDPAVQAGVSNLPTDLESAARYLGCDGKKPDGKRLIKLFSVAGAAPADYPEEWARFLDYAKRDVEAMREVYQRTRPLPLAEWREYWAFERVNRRGVRVDVPFVEKAAALAAEDAIAIGRRLVELTDGAVTSVGQAQRIAAWLHDHLPDAAMREALTIGAPADGDDGDQADELEFSLRRDRVARVLGMLEAKRANGGLRPDETKAFEAATLRLYGAGASPKKFARIAREQINGVIRDQYRFAGAGQTGRMSGKGAQLQNLTRDTLGDAEAAMVDRIADGCTHAELAAAEPTDVPATRKLALLVRPALIAGLGNIFVWSDWSAIEARITPWLAASPEAGKVLEVFRASDADPTLPDNYVLAAADILHKDAHAVTKAERAIGKVATLALGFKGSVGALQAMALSYQIHFDDAEARRIVTAWREANPWTREFWGEHRDGESFGLWGAAMTAWEQPGSITTAGRLAFTYRPDYLGGSLFMALPSGRLLTYPQPKWREVDILDKDGKPTGEMRRELSFRRAHGRAKLWTGTLCLAGDALVLTESGWLRIDQIKSERIWDGEAFVTHGGVICNGLRHVIDFDGVAMTPDHLILTTEGWKYAREGHRFERAPVRLPRGDWADRSAEAASHVARSMRLRAGVDHRRRQIDPHAGDARLSIMRDEGEAHTRHVTASGLQKLALDAQSPPSADTSGLAALWRPRDFNLQSLAGEFCGLLGGYGTDLSPGIDNRAYRQRGQLHAGELHLGDAESAGAQQTNQSHHHDSVGRGDDRRSRGAGRYQRGSASTAHQPGIRPVFDILDAGPRRRFVIATRSGPLTVHNCENAVQGTAADLLRQAVMRLETNPAYGFMPIRLHTHDEVLVEVDEGRAEEAKAILRREMLTLPDWAAGLPLQSEETVGAWYSKVKAAPPRVVNGDVHAQ